MSGALDSGMDIVLEISSGFILRILRKKLTEIDQGCFEGTNIPIEVRDIPLSLDARRIQFVVQDISFSQTPFGPVFLTLDLRLLYGQVFWEDEWKSLDELEAELGDEYGIPPGGLHSFPTPPLQLAVSTDGEQILLNVDTTSLDYLPPDLRDALGESIAIPVTFLNQTQRFIDEAGVEQVATLLALTINGAPMLKMIGANNLAIGLDVELSQDDDLRVLGPGVPNIDLPIVAAGDLVAHGCGLPSQPFTDRLAFDGFAESFADGNDWAIALDAHILDAILRGAPSANINDSGEETDDCAHEDALRSMCIRLDPPLEDGVIHISGDGEAFVCTPDWLFFVENGYYHVDFTADVTLTLDGAWVRAHYEITDFSVRDLRALGPDYTDLVFAWSGEEVPPGDDVNAFRGRFGESDDPAGRLAVETVEVRTNGLVLRGSSNVRPPDRSITARAELLFATGCQDEGEPVTRRFGVRNSGSTNLHLCPLALRADPAGNQDHVALFSVLSPPELLDDGEGLTLAPRERIIVEVSCSGEPGDVYTALLDIPNDAQEKFVLLNANFLAATIGPVAEELDLGQVEYLGSACNRPRDRAIGLDLEITNEGPGNMQICTIDFSADVENAFSAANPGTFAPGPATIAVTCSTVWGENLEHDGTMRIVTNGGEERVIRVRARVSTDADPFGVFNHLGFDRDIVCGDADWDRVQDTEGRILDDHEVAELLPILGGEPCCPPPRGPACLCVDLWETAFIDVPLGVTLEVVGSAGQPIATNRMHSSSRTLLTPFKPGNDYALRARLPKSLAAAQSSRISLRRWLAQQDALYTTSQLLSDVAVVDDHAYAVGVSGMEVISLSDFRQPRRVALLPATAGATGVVALDTHLAVVRDGVRVYSLANPLKPRLTGRLELDSEINVLLRPQQPAPAALLYAAGKRLHALDVSDLKQPREIKSVATRVRANRAWQQGHLLYLFGQNGMEIFDVTSAHAPRAIGLLRTKGEVRNAVLAGDNAWLVYDATRIDVVDVVDARRPRVVGDLNPEDWMREYLPLAGSFPRYKKWFLMLMGNRLGWRLMRVRPNKVDQEKLRLWRRERG